MKKLTTTDIGGQPVYFKDFEFIQEQIRELSSAAFGNPADGKVYVISGCEIATDEAKTITVSKGAVFYNNEMFIVDQHQAYPNTGTDIPVWYIDETNDPRGIKTFKDKTVRKVYKVRKMKVQYIPSYTNELLLSDTQRIGASPTGWETMPLAAGVSNVSENPLSIRRDSSGMVHIFGAVEPSQSVDLIATIPIGFRPNSKMFFPNPSFGSDIKFNAVDSLNNQIGCIINNNFEIRDPDNVNRREINFQITYLGE